MNSAPRTCTNDSAWRFRASCPVAPQGRGTGTFLILLCFCIAKTRLSGFFRQTKLLRRLCAGAVFFTLSKWPCQIPQCLFSRQKTAMGNPRRSFARFGAFSPQSSFRRAFAGCGVFLDRGNLSACKEGFRDSRQSGAEALSRFRRIPPRNSIGIRAARSHKERKVFALFICAR